MTHTPGQMTNVKDIQAFMIAGHATFTLVSTKTEVRFTYKIDEVPDSDGERFFVSILSGSDNQADYHYIGMMFDNTDDGTGFYFSPKEAFGRGIEVMKWFTKNLHKVDELPPQIQFWHEGKCAMCGKKLTTPESIERGFGPVCFTRTSTYFRG